MILLSLDVKKCMSEILLKDTFDTYLLINAEITTYATFSIDGYLQKEYFAEEKLETTMPEYTLWHSVKGHCLSLIKGKRTPLRFKFVFSLPADKVETLIKTSGLSVTTDDIQGLYLNFQYNGTQLQCTTGSSLHTFSMDKSVEHAWDGIVKELFKEHGVEFEIL